MIDKPWYELVQDEGGTVYFDGMLHGLRCKIARGGGSLVAYIGIPHNHEFAFKSYDNIDLDVHGGLTFAGTGVDPGLWNKGLYWLGWDYAHMGDRAMFGAELFLKHGDIRSYEIEAQYPMNHNDETRWTVPMVYKELEEAAKEVSQHGTQNSFSQLYWRIRRWWQKIDYKYLFRLRMRYLTWRLRRDTPRL